MFLIGDYILYKNEVCIVKDIKKKYYLDKDYYVLSPFDDDSLINYVPIENKHNLVKSILSKEEALNFVETIASIKPIKISNRLVENDYKTLLYSGEKEDLVKIIKTTYLRNEERKQFGKKISEIDDNYFKKAEKILYTELSLSLGLTFYKTKELIIKRVSIGNDKNE